jgi:hypothetical protein
MAMTAIPSFVEFRMKGSIDRGSGESQIGQPACAGLMLVEVPHLADGDCKLFNHTVDNYTAIAYLKPNG